MLESDPFGHSQMLYSILEVDGFKKDYFKIYLKLDLHWILIYF